MASPAVLHVTQPTEAGVARCVASYARDQQGRGWRVQVACPPVGALPDELRRAGVAVVAWDAARSPGPSTIGEVRRLRALISAADPDVVHLHSSKAGLAGRLVLRGRRPTIFEPHGWSFAAADPGPQRILSTGWERLGARWAQRVVCVSEQERLDGEEAGVTAPWRVIANGVDTEAFAPADGAQRAEARRRLGLDPESPVAVTVGRLVPAKGQRVLAEAWRIVGLRVPSANLLVVGGGPDHDHLDALAVPGLRLVGEHADVRPYLAAADVFVQPSASEAMSLALLEGMSAGLAAVATDVGGAREALGDASGAVVPSGDPEAMAEALVERLADRPRCRAEGRAAREVVVARFDERRANADVAALTMDLLAT